MQKRRNPINGYRFHVFINGQEFGFQQVTSIQQVVETETVAEGGRDYVHVLTAPPKNINTMTFKKGCATFLSNDFPFKVGQYVDGDIQIFVMSNIDLGVYAPNRSYSSTKQLMDENIVIKQYEVTGAIVTKWSLSDLNAESGELLIESFEVQYEQLKKIN